MKFEKTLGFRNMQEKLENSVSYRDIGGKKDAVTLSCFYISHV